MNHLSCIRAFVAIAALGLAGPGLPATPPVVFRNDGGDAWTFEKSVELLVDPGRCDAVAVRSPRATTVHVSTESHVKLRVPLAAGHNDIHAECSKNGIARGAAARQRWRVRLRDVPRARIKSNFTEQVLVLDAGSSEGAPTNSRSWLRYEWRARENNPAALEGLPAEGQRVALRPSADGEYFVTVRATDEAGRFDESTVLLRVRDGRWEPVDPADAQPSWIDKAIVYGAVPAFFGENGLADVTRHLDRLAALGVNTLWLSPITASPRGDFGYAVTDYFSLKQGLGGDKALRELIQAAHARGLRVILDFVPNHLSSEHTYFVDTEARARRSPYFDYFSRTTNGESTHYFGWNNLKNLNYDNLEVQRFVIEAFAYWVREFDVDGFRVDVAWGPRQRAPDFWPRWRAELKRIKPDLLLIAEASARDPYYGRNGFDAAYDWTEKLGEWAWRDAFEHPGSTAIRLRKAIAESAPTARVLRFLENNDTGARFVTRHGPSITRVAVAMLMTLPGIPALYTGQAIGAAYEPYGDPQPLDWNEDPHDLQNWYSRLIKLRLGEEALRSNQIRNIDLGRAESVLAYLRPGSLDGYDILVLLNYSGEVVRLPADMLRDTIGSRPFDVLNQRKIEIEPGASEFVLGGHQAMILKGSRPETP